MADNVTLPEGSSRPTPPDGAGPATPPDGAGPPSPHIATAPTAAAAVRATRRAAQRAAERAEEIRRAPELHVPKLVTAHNVRGTSWLNLPQLSIMISLQVSANRVQTAGDRRP
ncbi:MAG TPA: hypothetical protein VMV92_11070 [Streptosporangiaceae bacterium]|nr:hypothetical protein [Streptosporangiaceae bacterium]